MFHPGVVSNQDPPTQIFPPTTPENPGLHMEISVGGHGACPFDDEKEARAAFHLGRKEVGPPRKTQGVRELLGKEGADDETGLHAVVTDAWFWGTVAWGPFGASLEMPRGGSRPAWSNHMPSKVVLCARGQRV